MRVLLLGEYSSLYNNLAQGLRKLGHEVILANDGDGFKNYHRDIDLSSRFSNKLLSHINKIAKQIRFVPSFSGFDVVNIINPLVFSRFSPYKKILQYIKSHNGHLFLSAAGDDAFYWQAYRAGEFRYSPHMGTLKDYQVSQHIWETDHLKNLNRFYIDKTQAVIANAVEYYVAYESFVEKLYYIPFPIPTDNIAFKQEKLRTNEKLQVFHGVQSQRRFFKGSDIIDETMNALVKKYPNDIEYLRAEDLPYSAYINYFNSCHVLIDQLWSFSPAMNALTAMAKGKVVLSGFEKEAQEIIGYTGDAPLINVKPTASSLQENILALLDNRSLVEQYSNAARDYVVKYHEPSNIAAQYLEVWNK
jgi:glycosyltransferase involved in cell wall biosynthesis